MSSNAVFACAAGPGAERLAGAARLLMSLRWFGGSVANARFVLACADPIPDEASGLFRHYRADVVRIPFDPSSSCRIALLKSPAVAGHGMVVLLDPNMIILGDPAAWLDLSGVAAKLTDWPNGHGSGVFSRGQQWPIGDCGETGSEGSGRIIDTGVVLVDEWHRTRLATDWERCRSTLIGAAHFALSPDRADQVSLASAMERSDVPFHPLSDEMNLPLPIGAEGVLPGRHVHHPLIIQNTAVNSPSGFLTTAGFGPLSCHAEAFNSRLRAAGHASLPAAVDIDLQRKTTASLRPKVVVGSGWWCAQQPHKWSLGTDSSRSIAFFDVWYRQVVRCLHPHRIVVTDSASPIKPDYLSYAGVQWIELDKNYGHPNDVRVGTVQTKYSGFTRSVINGAMYALCCDADFYVYVEQDCLLHGEDFLTQAVGPSTEEILLGAPTENGRGIGGKMAAPMIQQSLMVVARPGLERFLQGLLGAPWTDGEKSPEAIMRLRLVPFGFVQVPYGRSRPINFARSHYYAQHLTDDELGLFLVQAGLELPERAFPFRADDGGPLAEAVPTV
jgi:hypothetical protein